MATFTKLRNGAWGVRCDDETVQPGDVIDVTKASGEITAAIIARVLWSGNGKAICSIAPRPAKAKRDTVANQGRTWARDQARRDVAAGTAAFIAQRASRPSYDEAGIARHAAVASGMATEDDFAF